MVRVELATSRGITGGMRRDIHQVQAASSGGRICRSEAVWDQEGVRPGGGRVHCAFALCAAPGLCHVGAVQGEEGGRGPGPIDCR